MSNNNGGLGDLTTMKDSVVTWVTENKMIAAAGALAVAGLVIYLVRPKKRAVSSPAKAALNGTRHRKPAKRRKKTTGRLSGVALA